MQRSPVRLLVFAAAGLLATWSTARSQEALRWKFKPGQSTDYQMVQKMDMAMNVMGQDVNTQMNQTMDMGWTVADIADDGTATLRQKISRMRMTMNAPFPIGDIEYDSDSEEEPAGIGQQFARIFGVMVGKEFTMKMNPRGEISDVTLPEGLDEVLQNAGGIAGASGFSKDSLKQMVTQGAAHLAFPAEPLKEGVAWGGKNEVSMPFGTMVLDNQFKYLGIESRDGRTLHKIALSPRMTMKANPDQPFKIEVKSQKADGTIYFDNDAGEIAESNMKQTMEMKIEAGGQVINQTIKQDMTMKRQGRERTP